MLKIDHICKTFNAGTINEKVALNGVDLTLEDGDFVTVIGGNGAGKSTTLNAVAGVWPVDSGKIFIGGDDVTKLSEYKRAKYLGRVFQDPMTGTATTMSIEENMAIAARRGRKRGLSWGITKAERDTYLGFNTQLTYKNWDFAISGHGAFGNYVYNYVAADQYVQSVYSDQGNFSNILRRTKDSGFQNQQLYSDYFLEKGNFFRIDNISLGYTFQKLWNGSSSLRLTLGVQNVATFTGYSGIDPEIYSGIDKEVYPRPRVFSLSANLNF